MSAVDKTKYGLKNILTLINEIGLFIFLLILIAIINLKLFLMLSFIVIIPIIILGPISKIIMKNELQLFIMKQCVKEFNAVYINDKRN